MSLLIPGLSEDRKYYIHITFYATKINIVTT